MICVRMIMEIDYSQKNNINQLTSATENSCVYFDVRIELLYTARRNLDSSEG
jgi:hypothetical protein